MTTTPIVRYDLAEGVATITLDDGKAISAPWFNHATTTGALYGAADAARAAFLDRVVSEEAASGVALEAAQALTRVNAEAHAATKLRVRRFALEAMRAGIDADFASA